MSLFGDIKTENDNLLLFIIYLVGSLVLYDETEATFVAMYYNTFDGFIGVLYHLFI